MATFGSVTCSIINGTPAGLRERTRVWEVPGIDGIGVQLLGKGSPQFELTAIMFDTLANVTTWMAAIEALVGTTVSVTNELGTFANVFVESMTTPTMRSAISGTYDTRGEVVAICRRTQ